MKAIRLGNDIDILWGIFTGDGLDEQPYDMTDKNITILMRTRESDAFPIKDFTIDRHIVKWRFKGKDQTKVGVYTLTLIENDGADYMHTVDECKAFQLVQHSCLTSCDCSRDNDNIRVTSLEFRTKFNVGYANSGIVVDKELSLESANPVQNSTLTRAFNELKKGIQNNSDDIRILKADANTEGSINHAIYQALSWEIVEAENS